MASGGTVNDIIIIVVVVVGAVTMHDNNQPCADDVGID